MDNLMQVKLAMYQQHQEMWVVRLKHSWKILIYVSIGIYSIILLPYIGKAMGCEINKIPVKEYLYSLFGAALAFLLHGLLYRESIRQAVVGETMRTLSNNLGCQFIEYPIEKLPELEIDICKMKNLRYIEKRAKQLHFLKQRSSTAIANLNLCMQVAVSWAFFSLEFLRAEVDNAASGGGLIIKLFPQGDTATIALGVILGVALILTCLVVYKLYQIRGPKFEKN